MRGGPDRWGPARDPGAADGAETMRGFVLCGAAALAATLTAGCRSTEAVRAGLGIDDASGPGRVRQVFPVVMDEVQRATVEAMGDLNIRVVQEADYAFELADGESWGRTDPADAGKGTRKVPHTAAGGTIHFADSTFTASDGRLVRLQEIASTTRGMLGDGRRRDDRLPTPGPGLDRGRRAGRPIRRLAPVRRAAGAVGRPPRHAAAGPGTGRAAAVLAQPEPVFLARRGHAPRDPPRACRSRISRPDRELIRPGGTDVAAIAVPENRSSGRGRRSNDPGRPGILPERSTGRLALTRAGRRGTESLRRPAA